ncbi:hypothetical protein, partial [Bacillus sp. ISL-101]|uniref:hypothetical protein n=1 Tax=Bacillus sp. ISL-101 TaxID=2819117 RepID=UPI002036D40E
MEQELTECRRSISRTVRRYRIINIYYVTLKEKLNATLMLREASLTTFVTIATYAGTTGTTTSNND